MRAVLFVLLFALVVLSQNVPRITVDDYTEGTNSCSFILNATVPSGGLLGCTSFFTSPNGVNDSRILGGERDLFFNAVSGVAGRVFSSGVGSGEWDSAAPNGASGVVTMQYDSLDASIDLRINGFSEITGTGNGLDITEGGLGQAFRLIVETDVNTVYTIEVHSPDGSECSLDIDIPQGNIPQDLRLAFNSFTGSCSFTNVGAIVIVIQAFDNVDTIVTLFQTVGIEAPSPSPSPVPPSISATPAASIIPDSVTPTRTPVNPSQSRTPTNTPSPSPIITCRCDCPNFRCGLVFDTPGDDDDNSISLDAREHIYRPVFYYAQDDDFASIHGDDGLETFVLLGGEVAKFEYGVDDMAIYLYRSDAILIKGSISLIFIIFVILF